MYVEIPSHRLTTESRLGALENELTVLCDFGILFAQEICSRTQEQK